ncbi:membrane protein [Streptosporangium violaceochromogenes]|nr:membrane protein [Streptosporangium violaceochromogenes]
MPRIREIDAIRAFALFGILLANIGYLADPAHALIGVLPPTDNPIAFLVSTLVLTKFYVIFSFLFGYSFTLQMRSWREDQVRGRMLRRCLGLFVLGALHGFFLWFGDILTLYAALGVILLLLRRIKPRSAVIVGCSVIGLLTLFWAGLGWLASLAPDAAATAADPAAGARAVQLITDGPLGFLTFQTESYLPYALFIWGFQGPTALALFLFGLAAGKVRLLEQRERREHLMRRLQWTGFLIGLPGAVFFAWASGRPDEVALYGLAVNTVTSPLLAAAYVVTLLRIVRVFPVVTAVLSPAGRAAASNYIGQSLLIALVFTGYGLGLAGQLTPLAVMGVAVTVYAVLLGLSFWWMRSHRYGPIEYGLRMITQGGGRPAGPDFVDVTQPR